MPFDRFEEMFAIADLATAATAQDGFGYFVEVDVTPQNRFFHVNAQTIGHCIHKRGVPLQHLGSVHFDTPKSSCSCGTKHLYRAGSHNIESGVPAFDLSQSALEK